MVGCVSLSLLVPLPHITMCTIRAWGRGVAWLAEPGRGSHGLDPDPWWSSHRLQLGNLASSHKSSCVRPYELMCPSSRPPAHARICRFSLAAHGPEMDDLALKSCDFYSREDPPSGVQYTPSGRRSAYQNTPRVYPPLPTPLTVPLPPHHTTA